MPRKEATLQLKRKRKANGKAETETKDSRNAKESISRNAEKKLRKRQFYEK